MLHFFVNFIVYFKIFLFIFKLIWRKSIQFPCYFYFFLGGGKCSYQKFLPKSVSVCLCHSGVLCSATQVVDDLISRAKDGKPVDWRYALGEDVYVIIKAPQLTIHIKKHFVPNGEWTLHPTKRGVTLNLYEWKELKKTIPLFEDREPELTIDNV